MRAEYYINWEYDRFSNDIKCKVGNEVYIVFIKIFFNWKYIEIIFFFYINILKLLKNIYLKKFYLMYFQAKISLESILKKCWTTKTNTP
jgi:hypothetical protein